MSIIAAISALYVPLRGCSGPPDGPALGALPPAPELGVEALPPSLPRETAAPGEVLARIDFWQDEECMAEAGCGTVMSLCPAAVELTIAASKGLTWRGTLVDGALYEIPSVSAPVWWDADHLMIGLNGVLYPVDRKGTGWHLGPALPVPAPAWFEPVRRVGDRLLVRASAARLQGEQPEWAPAGPDTLRWIHESEDLTDTLWSGEIFHRLYLLDLEQVGTEDAWSPARLRY